MATTKKTVTKTTATKGTATVIQLPVLKRGERWAGFMMENGKLSHHVILLPGKHNRRNFNDALKEAKKLGGDSPSRRELSLLRATMPEAFETDDYYWSNEQRATDSVSAWMQDFSYGYQNYSIKSASRRARVVRRVPI